MQPRSAAAPDDACDATGPAPRIDAYRPPTAPELARLVTAIATRVERLLRRHGLSLDDDGEPARDALGEDAPALTALAAASVAGRIVLTARPARACSASESIPMRRARPRTPRGTRATRASISMPDAPSAPAIAPGSSLCATTFSARRLPKNGSRCSPAGASA
jgi:hypothetical protein